MKLRRARSNVMTDASELDERLRGIEERLRRLEEGREPLQRQVESLDTEARSLRWQRAAADRAKEEDNSKAKIALWVHFCIMGAVAVALFLIEANKWKKRAEPAFSPDAVALSRASTPHPPRTPCILGGKSLQKSAPASAPWIARSLAASQAPRDAGSASLPDMPRATRQAVDTASRINDHG